MSDYRASDSRGRQYFGARPDRMDSARGGKLGAVGMRPAAGRMRRRWCSSQREALSFIERGQNARGTLTKAVASARNFVKK